MVYTVDGVQYTRRKKIPVTGAGSGAQTDYQIKLAATWAAAMQADFDDVRFTKADMQTLIDAWLESKVDSTSADIWVEFLTTPADGVEEIGAYMYFGNSVVASYWDGAATFLQYHGAASGNFLDSLTTQYNNVMYRSKTRMTSAVHNVQWGLQRSATANGDGLMLQSYSTGNARYVYARNQPNPSSLNEVPSLSQNTWYITKITNDDTTVYGYIDDNEIGSGGITTNLPNENMGLWLRIYSGTAEQDWSFASKHAANPPTAAFGTEEHQRRTPMMM